MNSRPLFGEIRKLLPDTLSKNDADLIQKRGPKTGRNDPLSEEEKLAARTKSKEIVRLRQELEATHKERH